MTDFVRYLAQQLSFRGEHRMTTRLTRSVVAAFAVVATAAGLAMAHSGATGIVKERMDHMGQIGKATKAIGQMLQGKTAYDAEVLEAYAREIAAAGGSKMTAMFPEGSIQGPSEARPEIWSDWDRFAGSAQELTRTASALADGAGNERDAGPMAPETLFAVMAGTCKSCHQNFRIKK